ncbi:MAG: PAS domain S-box protein [Alphaproteobacteria bacterium]
MFEGSKIDIAAFEANDMSKDKGRVLSRLLAAGLLVFGLCFSFGAYIGVSSFVNAMLNSNYRELSQETSDVVAEKIGEIEFSLRTVSTLIALSEQDDKSGIAQKLQNVGQSLSHFEDVLWLHSANEQGGGAWVLSPLYQAPVKGAYNAAYKDLIQQDGVVRAIAEVVSGVQDLRVVTRLYDRSGQVLRASGGEQLFGIVKVVRSVQEAHGGQHDAAVIFAITHFGHVFEQAAVGLDRLISRVSVRDIRNSEDLYVFQRANFNFSGEYDEFQIFSVPFGGQTFDVITRFFKQDDLRFVSLLPLFILFCGVFVTLVGAILLRNGQTKSAKFATMNAQLSQQNKALEDAMARRDTLNAVIEQAEKENRAIIDAVSDIIFEIDAGGKIVFLNKRWKRVSGFEVEQTIGQDLSALLHPQDQEAVEEALAEMRGNGQGFRRFCQMRCSNGSFRAVELSVSVMHEDDNRQGRIVGTIMDVEERRRAERALAQAEKKYRSIVENAAGGIFQLTPEGVYLSVNPAMAEVLGYESPEQILREVKNAHDTVYVDGKARSGFMRHLDQMRVVRNHEVQVQKRDGSVIWVNENMRCVRDEAGNTLYYEGSLEDISERKEATIMLNEAKMHSDMANRAKSEFLANMSHELRTPLNSIIGFSELIKDEVFGSIEQRAYWEYARDIHESGQGLLTIINEILDISKIEAGERQLNESVVDVAKVAGACLELLGSKITDGEVIVTNALENVPNVVAEELAVKQVFMNLLSNAVKFTPKGGRVTLSAEVDREGRLNVSFTDTGVGLDQDEIKKALSPFGQVNSELNRSGSGTGLGLTLVDALLKLHGGALDLFSQKGIGTTATAVFPADRLIAKKEVAAQGVDYAADYSMNEGAE